MSTTTALGLFTAMIVSSCLALGCAADGSDDQPSTASTIDDTEVDSPADRAIPITARPHAGDRKQLPTVREERAEDRLDLPVTAKPHALDREAMPTEREERAVVTLRGLVITAHEAPLPR